MRILVLGAGAIGSVLGGFLARAGHDVTLLGRAWHLDAVRDHGLRISGLWGEHWVKRLSVATRPEEVAAQPPFDWVFVCVKSPQTAEAAAQLPAWLGPKTLVCAFQNGLGNYETLLRTVPAERLALGRVIFGVELAPGHVRVTVFADEVLIGSPDAPQHSPPPCRKAASRPGRPRRSSSRCGPRCSTTAPSTASPRSSRCRTGSFSSTPPPSGS